MSAVQRRKSASRIPEIRPESPAGVALTTAVQDKLRKFLGADYTDRSLAQYVVVMLAHKTEQEPLGENLMEFLGEVDARELASWLFENLTTLVNPEPAVPEPQQAQQQAQQQQPRQQPTQPQAQQQQEMGQRAAAQGAAPPAAVQQPQAQQAQQEPDGLDLELEEADGGSDADTAEVAMEGGRIGGPVRRLQSAVVRDTGGDRRGRSRSRSPHHGRHSFSPRGDRKSVV